MQRILARLALLLVPAALANAQLSTLETDQLRLVYLEPLQAYLAPHVARCLHNSLAFQERTYDFHSDEKITVILTDFSDFGNAGAGSVPRNGMAVSIAPMNLDYETYPANERMNTLMNHELVHVVNFDRPAGWDGFFRGLFRGKVPADAEHPETLVYNYLTSPRSSAPRWFHEGIAVFTETWMAGGIGRAQGSYDEMVFRAMVRDGAAFADPLGLVTEATQANFQLEMNSYLYGTRFLSWLAYEYSPEQLIEVVRRDRGTRGYFAANFEKVFGEPLGVLWQRWIDFEKQWQEKTLTTIRAYPVTQHRDVSDRPLGSISRAFLDTDGRTIYVALNYPGRVAHMAAIDVESGQMTQLYDIKDPMMYSVASVAFDPDGKTLFSTRDHSAMRDIVRYELESGEMQTLMKNSRVGDLAFDRSDRSLWGVRHDNGMATIVRIPEPYESWRQVRTFAYGNTVYDLDVSSDGTLISYGIVGIDGRGEVQVCERDSLLAGSERPRWTFDFGTTIPGNFVFEPGDSTMLGSSYYTGVSNVFRYDLKHGELSALSNCETGYFRPMPAPGGEELVAFRYSGEGFIPTRIPNLALEDVNGIHLFGAALREKHSQLAQWKVGSPATVPLDSLQSYRGEYRGLRSLELESVVPVVEGYKSATAVGLSANFSDPISLHKISVTASYSPEESLPEEERIHGEASYERYDWRASFRWNDADFYDLFGPTKSSRKGWAAGLGYRRTLIHDQPRELDFSADLTRWGNLQRLPDYQNISASYDELLTGSARLNWRNRSFSIGAVDYEKGSEASLGVSDNHVNGKSFVQGVATLDLGVPLFAHSSIWLRSAGGLAPGDHDEPFSNFYFGGFGNNWIDRAHPKRYRHWSSLPGFELNELGGTNFVRVMVDWNLPPMRFSRLGMPVLHASWARTSLFAAGLVTNMDDSSLQQEAASLGGQLDLRVRALSHLDFTASVGYAFGIREGQAPSEELMVSLKVF